MGVVGAAFAPASNATPSTTTYVVPTAPSLSEACHIPSFASAHYLIQSGHAVSGTWTLAPRLTCTQDKAAMSISVTLKRNGVTQLSSSGSCHWQGFTFCKSAAGPRRTKSYSTTIRGTWSAFVSYRISGPDAILFAHSSPMAGTCSYSARATTATCHYDTAPIVIR